MQKIIFLIILLFFLHAGYAQKTANLTTQKTNIDFVELKDLFKNYSIHKIDTWINIKEQFSNCSINIDSIKITFNIDTNTLKKAKKTLISEEGISKKNVEGTLILNDIVHTKKNRLTVDEHFILGSIEYNGNVYLIEQIRNIIHGIDPSLIVIYNQKDVIINNATCGTTALNEISNKKNSINSNAISGICRTVDYALAADFTTYQKHNSSINETSNYLIGIMNLVEVNYVGVFTDDLFFNISEIVIFTNADVNPWPSTDDINQNLNNFTNWSIGGFTKPYDEASYWFNSGTWSGTVGLAWLSSTCGSLRVNAIREFGTSADAMRCLVAHEIGHNFSCAHTTGFIMNPSVNSATTWAPESILSVNDRIAGSGGACIQACNVIQNCTDTVAKDVLVSYDSVQHKLKVSLTIGIGENYKIICGINNGTNDTAYIIYPSNSVLFNVACSNNNPTYKIKVTKRCGNIEGPTLTFYQKVLTLLPKVINDNRIICQGNVAILKCSIKNINYNYRWYKNDVLILNETKDSLAISTNGEYSVAVNNNLTGNCWAISPAVLYTFSTTPSPKFSVAPIDMYKFYFTDQSINSTNYRWDFGNGQTFTNTSIPPTIDFVKAGRYLVTLQTDGCGGTAIFKDTVLIIVDDFEVGSPKMGKYNNLQIKDANCSKSAYFDNLISSAVEYPILSSFPKEGTIEWQLKIDSGFAGSNIYQDVFYLMGNSINKRYPYDIALEINNTVKSITFYSTNPPPFVTNVLGTLNFPATVDFKKWTTFGYSWGSQGKKFKINGTAVSTYFASFTKYAGDTLTTIDTDTVGIKIGNHFFSKDSTRRGFFGLVDIIRISENQQDWRLTNSTAKFSFKPVLNYTGTKSFCPIDSILLNVTPVNNLYNYKWILNDTIITGSNNYGYKTAQSGTYKCLLTRPSYDGCYTDTVKLITQNPSPNFTITKNGRNVIFTNTSTCANTYNWSFGNGLTSTANNPTVIYSANGVYNVCLSASFGNNNVQACKSVRVFDTYTHEFNNSTVAVTNNSITYESALCDKGAVFKRNSTTNSALNSSIYFNQDDWFPKEGTVEFLIKVNQGYTLTSFNTSSALIFGIGNQADYSTASSVLYVYSNGNILFRRYNQATNTLNSFTATTSPFRFNEWHIVSVSYGNAGTVIAVDGIVSGTNSSTNYPMNTGTPTLGQMRWGTTANSYLGFEGTVDRMRTSYLQSDFKLTFPITPTNTLEFDATFSCTKNIFNFHSTATPDSGEHAWVLNYNYIANQSTKNYSASNLVIGDTVFCFFTPLEQNCFTSDRVVSNKIGINIPTLAPNVQQFTFSGNPGSLRRWQKDEGNGFLQLYDDATYSGTGTNTLTITGLNHINRGTKYRCEIITNTMPLESILSNTFTITFTSIWKGNVDSDWFNTNNWQCSILPDEYTDVIISTGSTNYPNITGNTKINSLKVESGALLSLANGINLEIKSKN